MNSLRSYFTGSQDPTLPLSQVRLDSPLSCPTTNKSQRSHPANPAHTESDSRARKDSPASSQAEHRLRFLQVCLLALFFPLISLCPGHARSSVIVSPGRIRSVCVLPLRVYPFAILPFMSTVSGRYNHLFSPTLTSPFSVASPRPRTPPAHWYPFGPYTSARHPRCVLKTKEGPDLIRGLNNYRI